jgi:hypothetical protein
VIKVPTPDEHPEVVMLGRMSARHRDKETDARHGLATRRRHLLEVAAVLEEAYDEIRPAYQRIRIGRPAEVASLLILGAAETVVAGTVVQSLGLTATATDLVAVAVGGVATGLAWLGGHEWALAHDPQAAAAGRRGWMRLAVGTTAVFLAANLGVRIYYGVLAEQAARLGNGLLTPLLSGVLLTSVTAALMVVAAFVTAHAESVKEAQLRVRLRRVRAELRSLYNRVGVVKPVTREDPAAESGSSSAA